MEREELDFNVEDIKEAEDSFDFSDLEDLSLIPSKVKQPKEDSFTEKLEEKAEGSIKILGIIVLAVLAVVVIVGGIILFVNNSKNHTYEHNYNLGVESYGNMEYEKAIDYFEKALTYIDDANNVNERIYLYKCYKSLGENEKAIQMLVELLNYDVYNIEAISVVSSYYYDNNELDKLNAMIEKYEGTEAQSAISSYLLDPPAVSYDSGEYHSSIDVVLYSSTGDTIFYTLDGSNPTSASNIYTAPIKIENGTTTLKAIVVNSSGISSEVVECQYNIQYVAPDTPEVTPASGTYSEDQKITISNITEGCNAYYTLDGTMPTMESEIYTEPIDMPGGNNIFTVVTISSENVASSEVKRNYNLKVSEKYSFEDSIEAIKYVLIKNQEISADGMFTADGEEVKFVYYAKREVDKCEMYLMYFDIKQDGNFVRQDYLYGVDIQKGTCYKVTDSNGTLSAEEYK